MIVWPTVFILAVPLFFVWALIHEFSHLIVAKRVGYVKSWHMKLWPHITNGTFRWAAVYYVLYRRLSPHNNVRIAMAPRVPDLIAATALPFAGCFNDPHAITIWLSIWGAGVINFIVGSLGISAQSDLRQAARGLLINAWELRVVAFMLIIPSVILTLFFIDVIK